MLTSSRYHVTRAELETSWSIVDLYNALDVIELLDDGEEEAMKRARAEAERNKRSP